ncbi:uncharacterized protein LOC124129053 [Haliotis rufescens]|uniref:uncharacterized protein LOC124129053 n=1 Tax=Haliotis rufescens TaxID=6454 RepID=UPI00201EC936|nr:uncharacterized protein LOC124129053 [Haliotis rufescens]
MALPRRLWFLLLCALQPNDIKGSSCPDDVVSVSGGDCFFITKDEKTTYLSASKYCNANHKKTAFPKTLAANNELKSHLLRLNPNCRTASEFRYWVNIHRTEETPFFHVGSRVTQLPYTDWDPDKPVPKDEYGSSNCAVFACSNGQYRWDVNTCSKSRRVVCGMKDCPQGCSTAAETSTTASVNITASPNTTSTTQDVTTVGLTSNSSMDTVNVLSSTTMATQFHMGSTASWFEASVGTTLLVIQIFHFSS